ncbi:MAG TPA: hypothetical protein VFJ93_10480 [Gaiellaceae bacterium]|nr:hypothetical protein [Gaiellaceae bacterium]
MEISSRSIRLVSLFALIAAVFASGASASQLIDRNAKGVRLEVNAKGEALLSYTVHGRVRHVLAWGGVNAIAPTQSRRQVALKLDYAGGWGKYRTSYWKKFKNACRPYRGPKLAWYVAGCTAADGSYWALQAWQRMLPNYGVAASAAQSAWELRLSHWTGELPVLQISTDWAWHQWDHLFGTFSYGGAPVYGFEATPRGNPLDNFGRNVYVDTFDSAYGRGWRRENSFLTHTGTGVFCYSVNPHGSRPAGNGSKYRATVEGPGATPDVMWEGAAPGSYDREADVIANDSITQLGDGQCHAN